MKKLILLSLALVGTVNMHNAYAMEGGVESGKEKMEAEAYQPEVTESSAQLLQSLEMIDPTVYKIVKELPAREQIQAINVLIGSLKKFREIDPEVEAHLTAKIESVKETIREGLRRNFVLTVENQTDQAYTLDLAKGTEPGQTDFREPTERVQVLGTVPPQSSTEFFISESDNYIWGARLFDAQNNYFASVQTSTEELPAGTQFIANVRDAAGRPLAGVSKWGATKPFKLKLTLEEDQSVGVTIFG